MKEMGFHIPPFRFLAARKILVLTLLACGIALSLASEAHAQSPKLAADFAVAITQSLMAAPPLPTLDRSRRVISPQGGTVEASVKPMQTSWGETRFDKGVEGYSYGLGLIWPLSEDFSLYTFGMGSEASGETTATRNGSVDYTVRDIKTRSLVGAGGVNYRFMGTDSSILAWGVFLGGAYMKVYSESRADNGNITTPYTFNPSYSGLYQGLQLMIRVGPLRINPYALYFANFGESCQSLYSAGVPTVDSMCDGETGKVETHASFKGYGLNLGIKSLLVTVYSNAIYTNENIKVNKLSVTWGFVF